MEYLYCQNDNFEDFSSGRVLYSGRGIPNFPVRLLLEIYGRAKSYLHEKESLTIYDPCCGGGYALTILGMFDNNSIIKLVGSDVDEKMIAYAEKNMTLLSQMGLEKRKNEIRKLYETYGKESHLAALRSCDRILSMLQNKVETSSYIADCTKTLPSIAPDIIITDVPYGNLVDWKENETSSIDHMLEQLWKISHTGTVLAICMDKKQVIQSPYWKRLEKHNIGKRRFEILQMAD